MKKLIIVLTALNLLCSNAHSTVISATGGNEVGGGGIAESNILYAYKNIGTLINICLSNNMQCGINSQEAGILQLIIKALPQEQMTTNQIEFCSEKLNPGFFFVDGAERIAKTEYAIGAKIYINLDLLYPSGGTIATPINPDPTRPFDIPQAIGLLVHELGHHHGVKDHTGLDSLGAKVQTWMRAYTSELDGGPKRRYIIVDSIAYETHGTSDLIVRDNSQVISFSKEVMQDLKCSKGEHITQTVFWNLHWIKETNSPTQLTLPLRFRVTLTCKTVQDVKHNEEYEMEIDLNFSKSKSGLLILEPQLGGKRLYNCIETPQFCH